MFTQKPVCYQLQIPRSPLFLNSIISVALEESAMPFCPTSPYPVLSFSWLCFHFTDLRHTWRHCEDSKATWNLEGHIIYAFVYTYPQRRWYFMHLFNYTWFKKFPPDTLSQCPDGEVGPRCSHCAPQEITTWQKGVLHDSLSFTSYIATILLLSTIKQRS